MTTAVHPYIESLLGGSEAQHGPYAWLNERRAHALERANALSVPTTRDEEWRYTDLSPLYRTTFQPAEGPGAVGQDDLAAFELPEAGYRLTFVDGHFVAALSKLGAAAGLTVKPLYAAVTEQDPVLERHLARYAPLGDDPFVALNTAWLHQGAVLHIGRNAAADAPVHLLFLATRADVASYPRLLVIAEPGSDCVDMRDQLVVARAGKHHPRIHEVTGVTGMIGTKG